MVSACLGVRSGSSLMDAVGDYLRVADFEGAITERYLQMP